ncbi:MAG: metallophosphoesterase [Acidimicrobiales bacterium]
MTEIPEAWDLTTVAEDEVVFHLHSPDTVGADSAPGGWSGPGYEVITGLRPGTRVLRHGIETRTLDRPAGELLCRFATVNDLHFGETECGTIDDVGYTVDCLTAGGADAGAISGGDEMFRAFFDQLGPAVVRSSPEGATPYPEVMSRAAVSEITGIDPAAVVVKGDVTASGLVGEYDAFLQCYLDSFGDRLLRVRGNHDAFTGRRFASEPCQELALPGATIAVLDTVIEGRDSGQVRPEQLDWLDELGARADTPVLVFGHHHVWRPGSANPSDDFFGINPEDSEELVRVIARRPAICGYFAGHTHRNKVRRFAETADVPFAEVASVKDFPGSWAEYRVFEGGILQVHRRLSSSAALAWSEHCRALFWGMYPVYAMGRLEDRCFPILPRNSWSR